MDGDDRPTEPLGGLFEIAKLVVDGLALITRNTDVQGDALGWHSVRFSRIPNRSSKFMVVILGDATDQPAGESGDGSRRVDFGRCVGQNSSAAALPPTPGLLDYPGNSG